VNSSTDTKECSTGFVQREERTVVAGRCRCCSRAACPRSRAWARALGRKHVDGNLKDGGARAAQVADFACTRGGRWLINLARLRSGAGFRHPLRAAAALAGTGGTAIWRAVAAPDKLDDETPSPPLSA
jgi:hypothetical protein